MVNGINKLYPQESSQPAGHGAFFTAAADAYGDMRYVCAGLNISAAIAKFRSPQPNWLYQCVSKILFSPLDCSDVRLPVESYNVQDPTQVAQGNGVPHTVEIHAVWGPENTNGSFPTFLLVWITNVK
jgi:hypothetical protein